MTLLTSALQYAIQGMNYKRDLERIEKFIREARLAAWGNNLVPVQGQRKVCECRYCPHKTSTDFVLVGQSESGWTPTN